MFHVMERAPMVGSDLDLHDIRPSSVAVARPEQAIHRGVVAHLRQRAAPGLVWWHTPQGVKLGGRRSRKGINIQGSIMKGLGARAGVSDLVFLRRGHFYALELKAPGNTPTEQQLEFLDDVKDAGGFSAWCASLDLALSILEAWELLVGRAHITRAA